MNLANLRYKMQQIKIKVAIVLYKNDYNDTKKIYFINKKQVDSIKMICF